MPSPGEYLRLHPLQHNRCAETKKYGPNERTDQSSKNRTSNEEIANLSHAQFKTLVIRMLTEGIEYGRKIEEKVKTMQSEIKKNIQGTKKGRKLGHKSVSCNRRNKQTSNWNRMKK